MTSFLTNLIHCLLNTVLKLNLASFRMAEVQKQEKDELVHRAGHGLVTKMTKY